MTRNAIWISDNTPSNINVNGVLMSEKLKIGKTFDNFYRTKVIDLINSIDDVDGDPMSYEQLKSLSRAYYANKPNLNI